MLVLLQNLDIMLNIHMYVYVHYIHEMNNGMSGTEESITYRVSQKSSSSKVQRYSLSTL